MKRSALLLLLLATSASASARLEFRKFRKNAEKTTATANPILTPVFSLLKTGSVSATDCANVNISATLNTGASSAVTLGRSSTGTIICADGSMATASANKPRVGSMGGLTGALYVEWARNNLALRSAALATSPWATTNSTAALPVVTADQSTDLFGATSVVDSVAYPAVSAGYSLLYQPSMPDNGGYIQSGSVYLRRASGTSTIFMDVHNSAGTNRNPATTCTVTTTLARCVNENKLSASIFAIGVNVAAGDAAQSAQTIDVWAVQEDDSTPPSQAIVPSTYIPTAGTVVTRTTETASATWPLTLADATYCLKADAFTQGSTWAKSGVAKGIIHAGGFVLSSSDLVSLYVDATGHPVLDVWDDAAHRKTFTATNALADGSSPTIEGCNAGGALSIKVNGSNVAGTTSGTGTGTFVVGAPTTVYFGSQVTTNQLDGAIANIVIDNQSPSRAP